MEWCPTFENITGHYSSYIIGYWEVILNVYDLTFVWYCPVLYTVIVDYVNISKHDLRNLLCQMVK